MSNSRRARRAGHTAALTALTESPMIRSTDLQRPLKQSPASTSLGYLRLVRLENCLVAAVLTVLGAGTASGGPVLGYRIGVAACIIGLIVASGNSINDFVDRDVDAYKRPRRPIPSGRVAPKVALGLSLALAAAALALTFLIGIGYLWMVAAMLIVSFAYSLRLKKIALLGNVSVGALCGSTILFGAATTSAATAESWYVAGVVAIGMIAFEIAKTIEDEIADGWVGNLRTIASVLNYRQQRLLLCSVALSTVLFATLPIEGLSKSWAMVAIAAPMLPLLIGSIWRFELPPSQTVGKFILGSKVLWIASVIGVALVLR
jgi:4-hydroxybenzoate polyprenyltransferase